MVSIGLVIKEISKLFLFLGIVYFTFQNSYCQVAEPSAEASKKYDEMFYPASENTQVPGSSSSGVFQDTTSIPAEVKIEESPILPKDELALLLPKIEGNLYEGWSLDGVETIWEGAGESPDFAMASQAILNELKLKKILKQKYKKDNHIANLVIYKFSDFAGAYSAFTVLSKGTVSKLKVGKNAIESDSSIGFWKNSYYINIYSEVENDSDAKQFINLISQEVANNIKIEQPPPVVAIQLPSLNRIPGTEKYCLGVLSCKEYISSKAQEFNPELFNIEKTGGVISANYEISESPKDKSQITLILIRYTENSEAENDFNKLKDFYEKKSSENKEIDIDFNVSDSTISVKNEKKNYTVFKQRGNLLSIVYFVQDKKQGDKMLDFVPWPIEIKKPELKS